MSYLAACDAPFAKTFSLSSTFAPLNVSTAILEGIGRWLFHFFLMRCYDPDDVNEKSVDMFDLLSPVNSDTTVPLELVFFIVLGNFAIKIITKVMTSFKLLVPSTYDLNPNVIFTFFDVCLLTGITFCYCRSRWILSGGLILLGPLRVVSIQVIGDSRQYPAESM